MSPRVISTLIKVALLCLVLGIMGGLWYYTIGRKPKVTLSAPITPKSGTPRTHLLDQGQVLLVAGGKATLYEMGSGQQKWSADLTIAPKPEAKPAPAPAATPRAAAPPPVAKVATPAPAPAAPEEKPDPLLVKRVQRHFAKLEAWSAKLNQKRATLKTDIQVEAFNEEAAKYHAELLEAQEEAAPLHKAERARLAAQPKPAVPAVGAPVVAAAPIHHEDSTPLRDQSFVVPVGPVIWITHGNHALGLDQASGHLVKDVPLAGSVEQVWPGNGCLYLAAHLANGTRQIARINGADGAIQAFTVSAEDGSRTRFAQGADGQSAMPQIPVARTEFSSSKSELLQVDIRLVEKKITERQVVSGDSTSEMEAADKKTTGGWGNDAAIIGQALARDAARERNGGKEWIDESTYEITLRRPFAAGSTASAPIRVKGRPEILSTPTLDLIAASQQLLAFDRTNHQVWSTQLAQPLLFSNASETTEIPDAAVADAAHPCLEDGERLYLFDQAFLNTLDLKTGKPVWRLPSIGIHKLQLDGQGVLYVSSANGTEDSLQFAGGNTHPLLLKLDAKQGKILWKLEKYEDCFVSGGDLYATRETRNAEDAQNQVFDPKKAPQTRFKLYKLSVRNGEPQWEWFQIRRPLQISTDHKKVSLLFADELQVIKSISM